MKKITSGVKVTPYILATKRDHAAFRQWVNTLLAVAGQQPGGKQLGDWIAKKVGYYEGHVSSIPQWILDDPECGVATSKKEKDKDGKEEQVQTGIPAGVYYKVASSTGG